ncbi:hypothetical protein A4R26_04225 [Niastella populi]|uniref:Uncharacterized protein n=2 Tax=Niastella populi TaxID=550983 RepID=A0A1V9FDD0_9BACT|nr:hypothetical protein A4R26_04225 [Niastella populi]
MTGREFYQLAHSMRWDHREPIVQQQFLAGNVPPFLRKFKPVHTSITDSTGRKIRAVFYVTPDYLSIGNAKNWARVPLTPGTAQAIADSLHCFLPTRKMVNDIYTQATVKLEPVPLYAFRDSAITFWHHHLIIEGQRAGKKGLIAGIKKDVVSSGKISGRNVVIYGWHQLNGKPIQPLYGGHINWYVDYSHGIRLVSRRIKVNGRLTDYREVLSHPVYRKLLCDEDSVRNYSLQTTIDNDRLQPLSCCFNQVKY